MNMKKILFSFLLLIIAYTHRAQTFQVTYNFTDSYYNLEDTLTIKGTLIYSDNKSLYTNHLKQIEPGTTYITENNTLSGNLIPLEDIYFKSFKNNLILGRANVSYLKDALLKDSLNLFKWEILDEEKTILGYACKAAASNFRGRNYKAYYAPEIPISDGPWKFNGLPGLILEVVEENNRIHYEAVELKIESTKTSITSPFDVKKALYWDEVIAKAKKRFRAKKNEIESKYSSKTSVTFNGIEVYDLNE